MKHLFIIVLLLSGLAETYSQELFTLDQAIELAMKNNFDIQIAKNEADIAARNNSVGNAGMLPKINANLGDNFTLSNLNQKFTNGTEINRNNVTGNNLNASVALNWTLFDGLKMFATKTKFKRLEEIGEIRFKEEVQNVVAGVINAYYDVVRAQQQLRTIQEAILISDERVKLAETKFKVGISSKVDWLQARVDLNEQKSLLLTQQKQIEQRKADLNNLIGRNVSVTYDVIDSIPSPDRNLSLESDKNFQLQSALKNVEVAKLAKKEVFSQFLPNLTGNLGYSFGRASSTAGFSLFNQNYGLNAGFGLSIPLFNGLNTIRQNKVAAIEILNSQFNLAKVRFQVQLAQYRALKDFANAEELLKLEQENISLAEENLTIATERFRLSQSTAIEFREAQISFVNAQTRLVNARYTAIVAHTELARLRGDLVK